MNEFQEKLEDALTTHSARSAVSVLNEIRKDPKLHLGHDIELQLSYVRMISLSVNQLKELLQQSVLEAYNLEDFLLSEQIEKYAAMLMDAGQEIEMYRMVKDVLSQSQEKLGQSNLTIKGKSEPSTIASWIKDYDSLGAHGPLHQIQYMNTSSNVKSLTEDERAILLDILKVYDKAASMVEMWDGLEVPEEGTNIYEGLDPAYYIPGLEIEDSEVTLEENEGVGINATGSNREAPQIIPQQHVREASDFKIPLQKDLDLKTQPRRGVVLTGTNINPEEAVQQKREEEIQAKLDELKDRQNKQ